MSTQKQTNDAAVGGSVLSVELEFTDRYHALGILYPNTETVCHGPCEGTGWVPISEEETDPVYRALAKEVHITKCPFEYTRHQTKCDGWHFVRCQDCNGTGLTSNVKVSRNQQRQMTDDVIKIIINAAMEKLRSRY